MGTKYLYSQKKESLMDRKFNLYVHMGTKISIKTGYLSGHYKALIQCKNYCGMN